MKQTYQLGDIIIFKAEDDTLSKCIAWLTDSDVSHSAMIYTGDSIAETVAPGVIISNIQVGKGEAAYLLRLNPPRDPQPLIHAAEKYLDAKTHYNFPALVYLAGLLLFRKIRPTYKVTLVAEKIMTLACLELDKLLQKLAGQSKNRSMVCSQFVYQVYCDCGKEYEIRIHSDCMNGIDGATDTIRLFDLRSQDAISPSQSVRANREVSESEEELITQLYEALDQSELTDAISVEEFGIQPIVNTFCDKLEKLANILKTDMPIDSLFVSPADFVYHAENLENMGEILIERVR